jgi:hypothetical protein
LTDQPVVVVAPERDADPRNWRLDVDQASIDLYASLLDAPRALTANEATMMVDLVNAWRAHEHEKHIALMAALDEVALARRSGHDAPVAGSVVVLAGCIDSGRADAERR